MNYISTTQASELWGITANRISILAKEGRIPGAVQIGTRWMIPDNAEKPADARTKNPRKIMSGFRFPFFLDQELNKFNPPLSEEEQQLRTVQLLFAECRFSEAGEAIGNLAETSENNYIRLSALFFSSMLCTLGIKSNQITSHISQIKKLMSEDFPYKKEMSLVQYMINISIGTPVFELSDFSITPEDKYHPTANPYIMAMTIYSLCIKALDSEPIPDISIYEIVCSSLEANNCFCSSQIMHMCLCVLYSALKNHNASMIHLRKALEIAETHKLYYIPALYYSYLGTLFDSVISDCPKELAEIITEKGKIIHNNYINFINSYEIINIYNLISRNDFQYVLYAAQNITNKELSGILHLSESTIAKKYSKIYDSLGISSKSELKDLFSRMNSAKALAEYTE